jgi:cytochrome d ubiquinol oxidase subunit II
MIVIGSVVPAFLWGVAFANVVRGVPLDADHDYIGTFVGLLNPYALLGGLTTLLLFFTHGLVFVALKTEGGIRDRARRLAMPAGLVAIIAAAVFLAWTTLAYGSPLTAVIAVAAAALLIGSAVANLRGKEGWAFGLMAATTALAVATLFASLFPDVMPASNNAAYSLTIENAASTPYTLGVMSWTALFALPVILLYQGWSYWVFRKRIGRSFIEGAGASTASALH